MKEGRIMNSEILFIYDAKNCNPNGDPDNENKPRMDYKTRRNLVSDVRLKRYIRDYLNVVKDLDIFVRKVDGKHVDATTRVNDLEVDDDPIRVKEEALKRWIDVRLFGATLPIKRGKGETKGKSISIVGPVQFTWGYSLNRVELLDASSSITSILSGSTEGEGNIGKDWRVKYSLIAFYGRINRYSAEETGMSEEDLELLDEAIWEAIKVQTNTRSKIGQEPRFYVRVEFKDNTVLGDLRRFVSIDKEEGLEDVGDFSLDISELVEVLKQHKDRIHRIIYKSWKLKIIGLDELRSLAEEINGSG